MCGITGFIDLNHRLTADALRSNVMQMADTLRHRGPDFGDAWVAAAHGVALGHRRLSIMDLSPTGNQPMHSLDGRYVIVYNGEVYNFPTLRATLEQHGHRFQGTSDTEIVLAACSQWGVRAAVERFNGMFAIALWDQRDARLYLIRDRLGIKPLYYARTNGIFWFGSQLQALRVCPGFQPRINRDALTLYLRYNYIPAPFAIYEDVWKLGPGQILTFALECPHAEPQIDTYWSAQTVMQHSVNAPLDAPEADILEELETLLADAVRIRMIADVPLGAFLSGGIDSSLVVALMQSQSAQTVKTFSIGFHVDSANEAVYAKAVADHLGTEHTELYASAEDALAVIPRLPSMYDEPFSDSSQIPTFLVSQLTRQYVTVSLSGDGGDELFAGYSRYANILNTWQKLSRIPQQLRRAAAAPIWAVPVTVWAAIPAGFGEKVQTGAGLLAAPNRETFYHRLFSHWKHPHQIVRHATEPVSLRTMSDRWITTSSFVQWMQYIDILTYMVDDILVKVDRASMAVSLEARVPLIDYRVAEFAFRLPTALVQHDGQGKWPLRQILNKYVPQHLTERPKHGFGLPLAQWLKTSLRDWAEALLDPERLQQEGFFDSSPIHQAWQLYLSGQSNYAVKLWDVLMFQAWLDEVHAS